MSAVAETFLSKNAKVDEEAVQPFPNSRKIYIEGSRADIRVPMREISCSDTHTKNVPEKTLTLRYTIPLVPILTLKLT